MKKEYEVAFEIAGPAAMFTRPDTGSTPISYPVPTFSAAKGMFEAILRRPHVYVYPTRVEICKPIRFERYVTNYGGPLRKADQINNKNNYQLMATILVDVCYRIYGEIRMKQSTRGNIITKRQFSEVGLDGEQIFKKMVEKEWLRSLGKSKGRIKGDFKKLEQEMHAEFGKNFQKIWSVVQNPVGRKLLRVRRGQDWRPQFKKLFDERLERGQTFYTPCLGWKEFVPNYFGPFQKGTKRETSVDDIIIPSFLRSMWEHRQLKPEYVQDWRIVKGVMSYVHQTPTEEEINAE